MGGRDLASPLDARQAHVLDLVTGRAESDHPGEALNSGRLVVLPYLVTLDRMLAPVPAAHLTAPTGKLINPHSYPIPILTRDLVAHVRKPTCLGH
jgi:hypothetical protein